MGAARIEAASGRGAIQKNHKDRGKSPNCRGLVAMDWRKRRVNAKAGCPSQAICTSCATRGVGPTSPRIRGSVIGTPQGDPILSGMANHAVSGSPYSAGDEASADIRALFQTYGGNADQPYLHELVVTALKLSGETPSSGELKLANSALKEMRHAFRVFAPYRDRRKVTIFGSARTPHSHPWSGLAREFAAAMAGSGWMVITGGAAGVMGAGIEGAGRDSSFAALIRLPLEEVPCPLLDGDPKQIRFKYFFTRKLVFVKESDAICILPGGFGTHDEAFEILTLMQTGKAAARPVVLLEDETSGFWTEWLDFQQRHLLARDLVDAGDFDLLTLARSPGEAAAAVRRFYRVYHSQRRIGDRLVLRLNRPLSDMVRARLAAEHADAISRGGLLPSGPLPEEADEPRFGGLPRLVLEARFDRPTAIHRLISHLNDA